MSTNSLRKPDRMKNIRGHAAWHHHQRFEDIVCVDLASTETTAVRPGPIQHLRGFGCKPTIYSNRHSCPFPSINPYWLIVLSQITIKNMLMSIFHVPLLPHIIHSWNAFFAKLLRKKFLPT